MFRMSVELSQLQAGCLARKPSAVASASSGRQSPL